MTFGNLLTLKSNELLLDYKHNFLRDQRLIEVEFLMEKALDSTTLKYPICPCHMALMSSRSCSVKHIQNALSLKIMGRSHLVLECLFRDFGP